MTADALIMQIFPGPSNNIATHLIQFTATDDPRFAQIPLDIDITLSQQQIQQKIKEGVANFINQQRGVIVISASDVRLP